MSENYLNDFFYLCTSFLIFINITTFNLIKFKEKFKQKRVKHFKKYPLITKNNAK